MTVPEQYITVNGTRVPYTDEATILHVVRQAGFDLPTLCYVDGLSIYGGCRQCLVETEQGRLIAACTERPTPGLAVKTHTPRVQKVRRMALELILAGHNRECTTCSASGQCGLQDLAELYQIDDIRFPLQLPGRPIDNSSAAIVHDADKCILCGACVRACAEIQHIGALDFSHRGSNIAVSAAFNKGLADVPCVQCGQCTVVCPTGALAIKDETASAWEALHDDDQVVVVQVAPAVRVALGEAFGMAPGTFTMGKLVTALRLLGADYVFDTTVTADLTIMEETNEFLQRLATDAPLPMFTSCCPAWVKHAEHAHPDLLPQISTCRSPQQMFGSVIKRYFANKLQRNPHDIFVLSIMPCTAKKFEAARPEFHTDGARDVDLVLTTQELARMIRQAGIRFAQLPEGEIDTDFGAGSGAGVIFGTTGGVAEAVLRAAHYMVTGTHTAPLEFLAVRGEQGIKSATVNINGTTVRMAVTHTLANAEKLVQAMADGDAHYDIIEVMACPGGCIGGAGQPKGVDVAAVRTQRARSLYAADEAMDVRRSPANPAMAALYDEWLGEPLSDVAHEALHTTYTDRSGRPQVAQVAVKA